MEKRPQKDEVKFSNTQHNSNQYLHQYLIYLCQAEQLQQEGMRSSLLTCQSHRVANDGLNPFHSQALILKSLDPTVLLPGRL